MTFNDTEKQRLAAERAAVVAEWRKAEPEWFEPRDRLLQQLGWE